MEGAGARATAQDPGVVPQQQDVPLGDVPWRPGLGKEPRVEATARKQPWHWYGEPILIGDGTAYLCLLLAATFDMTETHQVFIPPAMLGYALVGPITHVAQGNWGRMGLSLLARGVLPMAGLALGASSCADGGSDCVESVISGGVLGMVLASTIDAGLIAREPAPQPPSRAWLAPALELSPQRAFFGAAGTF